MMIKSTKSVGECTWYKSPEKSENSPKIAFTLHPAVGTFPVHLPAAGAAAAAA
jgi:hypothetical protein